MPKVSELPSTTSPPLATTTYVVDAGVSKQSQIQHVVLNVLKLVSGIFNVKEFGAIGNGLTDDTTAIQSAITAAAVSGGTVYFPPGTYKVTGLTIEADKVILMGAGREDSIIAMASATGNTITIGATGMRKETGVVRLGFIPSVTRTSGAEIAAKNFLFLTLDYLKFTAPFNAIVLGQAGNLSFNPKVSNIEPAQGTTNGSKSIFLYLIRVLDGQFSNISSISLANTKGIFIDGGCEGNQFVNVHCGTGDTSTVQTAGQGLLINNTLGGGITNAAFNRFSNCLFDAFFVGCYLIDGVQNTFANCWFSSQGIGIIHGITGGSFNSATGTSFVGGQAYNCLDNGVVVKGAGAVTFSGFSAMANNRRGNASSSSASAGFLIDQDSGATTAINGCICSNEPQHFPSNQQHYGIWITNTSGQEFNITGNILAGNTTGAINNLLGVGAGRIIRGNSGYRTESSGTSSVASGSTSVNVTHSLSPTPATSDITITPTNNPTNNVRHWVSAVSSTTFTLSTSGDPGASGLSFSWRGVVL